MKKDIEYYKSHIDEIILDVPKDERETVVNYYYTESNASIYTSDNTVLTKLKKNIINSPEEYKVIKITSAGTKITSITISCPKKYVSFRRGARSIE